MENIPLLRDIVILIAVSVPVIIIFARVGLPTVVGFLLTGVIIGPGGLGLVTDMHSVEVLAEIGVVLLLFTIGLEFSVTKMLRIRRQAIIGGGLQVLLTTAVVFALSYGFGISVPVAILLGFIVSLSSTAIVLKLLLDKGEVNTTYGGFSVAILLFQDLAVVFMVIVAGGLGSGGGISLFTIGWGLLVALVAIAVIVALASYILPKLFYQVVKLRNREIFILTIVAVCFGTAVITSYFGLSLALGAFIAGLVISESEYSDQVVTDVIPFKETFTSLFFISIGMLLELKYFASHFPSIILIVVAVILLKTAIITIVARLLGYPIRYSLMVGLSLAQVGEFSFILIKMGQEGGLLYGALYQTLLAVTIITMAVSPFLFQFSERIAFAVGRVFSKRGAKAVAKETGSLESALSNHVVIIGYGINGENLATVLKKTSIEHIIIDTSAERIRKAKKQGHKAFFSDATHPVILKKAGVEKAKCVVVAIADPIASKRIVKAVRDLNGAATLVVRTRFVREVEELYKLGASQVIPEEFETSVEIFSTVLRDYRIPPNIIENQIDLIREGSYAMLRHPSLSKDTMSKLTSILDKTTMDTYYIEEGCSVAEKTLGEVDLRKNAGATVIAAVRKGVATTNPQPDFLIKPGDILVIIGSHAQLHSATEFLKRGCSG